MYDKDIALELLDEILIALKRIPARMQGIDAPEAFKGSDAGFDKFDAICMVLLAVGEIIKTVDRKTDGFC